MKKIFLIIVAIILITIIALTTFSSVLFLAEDESEGLAGVDMAATWNFTGGFNWIYPGSTSNAGGATLHNIHQGGFSDPYGTAQDMVYHTYGINTHLIIIINNNASEKIFGGDIISSIRTNDWGKGYDRGPAIENAMSNFSINIFQVIPCILTGDIRFVIV